MSGRRTLEVAGSIIMRGVRVATPVTYVVLVAFGALVEPLPVVVLGSVAAVAGGVAVLMLRRGMGADLPPLPHPLAGAVTAAGLPAALTGSGALGPWGGLALAMVLTGAALLCGNWLTTDTRFGPGIDPAEGGTWDEHDVRRLLATVPTDLLLEEWQNTQRVPGPGGDPIRVVRLRELLIDELQARDPSGTARWLREGPAEPPSRYIRPDSPSTGDPVR